MYLEIRREIWAEDVNLKVMICTLFRGCGMKYLTIKIGGNKYVLPYIEICDKIGGD